MRRWGLVLALSAALLYVGAAGTWFWLQGYRPEPEHGALLGAVDNVPIYYHRAGHDRRGKHGLEFECVEFVNRWLAANNGHRNLSRTGHALSYFEAARAKGLQPYPNGGGIPPASGDVIVFSSSNQPYGHAGIIREVEEGAVLVAQQNATLRAFGLVKPLPFERFRLRATGGNWLIEPRSPLTCVGWARRR